MTDKIIYQTFWPNLNVEANTSIQLHLIMSDVFISYSRRDIDMRSTNVREEGPGPIAYPPEYHSLVRCYVTSRQTG